MAKPEPQIVIAMPLGYRQLGTQVAGHRFEPSNAAAVGLLQDAGADAAAGQTDGEGEGKGRKATGRVFKPMGKPECGVRELNFYESLLAATGAMTANELSDANSPSPSPSPSSALLAELAAHVPRFYGQVKLLVNQREHTFLQLEDLTHGLALPCVMDVKIGKRTWDPLSSPHKRAIEQQKYVVCKEQLGLCLPGFQVYQETENQPQLIRQGRDYGKSLNVQGFKDALALFFNLNSKHCAAQALLLSEVLRQLRSILSWFKRQRLLHFYASSLLICYDFEQLQRAGKSCQNGYHPKPAAHWIRVRCIDFAHIFPAEDAAPDHNYMFGLQSLIDIVEGMLER